MNPSETGWSWLHNTILFLKFSGVSELCDILSIHRPPTTLTPYIPHYVMHLIDICYSYRPWNESIRQVLIIITWQKFSAFWALSFVTYSDN